MICVHRSYKLIKCFESPIVNIIEWKLYTLKKGNILLFLFVVWVLKKKLGEGVWIIIFNIHSYYNKIKVILVSELVSYFCSYNQNLDLLPFQLFPHKIGPNCQIELGETPVTGLQTTNDKKYRDTKLLSQRGHCSVLQGAWRMVFIG